LPYLVQFNELFSAPFSSSAMHELAVSTFPTGAFAIVDSSSGGFRQGYFDPNPRRNYVMQWNLTLARDLARDVSLRVGYVGSRASTSSSAWKTPTSFYLHSRSRVTLALTSGSGMRLNVNAGLINAGLCKVILL